MAGDASTRTFYRITPGEGKPVIIMDYGASFEGSTADMLLNEIFLEAGLPVAGIIDAAPNAGCLVLEDLGDMTLEAAVSTGTGPVAISTIELYRRAVKLAAAVAVRGTPVLELSQRADGPSLDTNRFRFEMEFFLEHYVTGLKRIEPGDNTLQVELFNLADRAAAASPKPVLCHRDYHSRNLMVRADGSLAMVDIQDARWGPDSYDLASLLHDCYVDIDTDLFDNMIDLYLDERGWGEDPASFRGRFDLVSLQRLIKALGTFGFQAARLKKDRYLEGVPRALAGIEQLLGSATGTEPLAAAMSDAGLVGRPG